MLKNEELFIGAYRAWYAMLSTFREAIRGKEKWVDMLRANVLCK